MPPFIPSVIFFRPTFERAAHALAWRVGLLVSSRCESLGVEVAGLDPDDEGTVEDHAAARKVQEAIRLFAAADPPRFARLRDDVARVFVLPNPRIRGRFVASPRICELDLTWVADPETPTAAVAMTLAHEATHARLAALGVGYPEGLRIRIERLCVTAEIALGRRLPGAEALVEQARRKRADAERVWGEQHRRERERRALLHGRERLRSAGIPAWGVRLLERMFGGTIPAGHSEPEKEPTT